MGTVASELKSEREKRKISLTHIASETRISLRHLESLEEGRFSDLPGGIYNRAFLRAYCEALQLDNLQEIMQRYESELPANADKTPRSKIYLPSQSRSFHISPLLIWGIMLLLSATGLFFSRNWITAVFSPYFSHTPPAAVPYEPARTKPVQTPPVVTAKPAEPTAPPTSLVPATVEPTPSSPAPSVPAQPPVVGSPTPAGTAAPTALPSTQPLTAGVAATQQLRLEISATAECWVSLDKDGSPVFRKTMQPGEIQQVSAGEKFQIILGNAGGIQLKINGKPAKPLGKPGEVIKLIIDAGKLQELLDQSAGR